MTKKKPILAYLDEFERDRLEKLAEQWGCSLSAAIKRLIREKDVEDGEKSATKNR